MSSRVGFLINSGCKMLSRVQRCVVSSSSIQTEKGYYRLVNLNLNPLLARNFSTLRNDTRTRENRIGKSMDLSKIRYLRCDYFSNQIEPDKNVDEKLGLIQKFKVLWKNYWYVMLPVHMVTSCFWFGGFYYLVASGMDVVHLLETLHIPDFLVETVKSDQGKMAGNAVAAIALYKVASPARYFVTVGGTTVAINYLKNRGLIKPASKEQIQKLYKGRKEALENLKDKMQVTKDEYLKKKKEIEQQCRDAKEEVERSLIKNQQEFKMLSKEVKRELGVVKQLVTIKKKNDKIEK